MNLPDGIAYRMRQEPLIAKDRPALISIRTAGRLENNAAYLINDRRFDRAIAPYLQGDWADFDRRFGLSRDRLFTVRGAPVRDPVIYSGAQHTGDPKLPNVTVVPNLATTKPPATGGPFTLFGCTMGHFHLPEPSGERTQEVYEFQSYGLLVLDREEAEVEVWVARAGDKVAVPSGCHMTLYNLDNGDNPLVTLDFANPERNLANKDLVERAGPILLAYYNDQEVVFQLNRTYINSSNHRAGVRLVLPPSGVAAQQIRLPLSPRLGLGRMLYTELTSNSTVIGDFARLGMRLRPATPETALEPLPSGQGRQLYIALPMVDAVWGRRDGDVTRGTPAYRYFFPDTAEDLPRSAQGQGIKAKEDQLAARKAGQIRLDRLDRPLQLVVEGGSGDWVRQAYRPTFLTTVAQGGLLRVFYADDSRWQPRPDWADPAHPKYDLRDWETFLDKADPDSFARYQNLRPDAVFVVTPDFTHATLARFWLEKTSLVLVEKPFDSQLENVDELLRELGFGTRTAVLGLDHYQDYAQPIHQHKQAVVDHLGGALARVEFYMTEDRPIELGRERSLQTGLLMDLLCHFPAMLTYFGDTGTIDDIHVKQAMQYDPLIARSTQNPSVEEAIGDRFPNETYARIAFTFQDYAQTGFHVPCVGTVGKGVSKTVKYLEVTGLSGHGLRVDLGRAPNPNSAPDYPWFSVFLLATPTTALPNGTTVRNVPDPYRPDRTLAIIEDLGGRGPCIWPMDRRRFAQLLGDLMNGTNTAIGSTLLLNEARGIVWALDRMWWATQVARVSGQWPTHLLGGLDPMS